MHDVDWVDALTKFNSSPVRRGLVGSVRVFMRFTPPTRWYGVRAAMLRGAGFDVDQSARVTSSVRVYTPELRVGSRSFVGHEVRFYGGPESVVDLAEDVDVGPNVLFLAGSHERGTPQRRAGKGRSSAIVVGPGCWIGGGAVLIGPVVIGPGCVVGAGEIVRTSIPANSLYVNGDVRPISRAASEGSAESGRRPEPR